MKFIPFSSSLTFSYLHLDGINVTTGRIRRYLDPTEFTESSRVAHRYMEELDAL